MELIEAVKKKNYNKLVNLIESKANINIQNKNGNTALMFSVSDNNDKFVEKLLESKACIDIQNAIGDTAMDYAYSNKIIELIKYHKRRKIVDQMTQIFPFPVVGGHIVLYEWIAEYVM